jgi:hypothetical protein
VRVELTDYVAWKGEFRRQEITHLPDVHTVFTQVSYAF